MLPALSGCSLCSRPATGTCGALVAFATPKSLLTAPERQSRPPPPPSSCSAAERPHPLTPTHTYSLSPRSSSPPANAMACTLTTPTAVLAGTPVAKRTLRSRRPAAAACQQQRRRLFKVAAAAEPEPKAGSVQVGACQPRASLAVLAPARCRTHAPGLHPPAPNTARPAACLPAATGANRRPAWPPPPYCRTLRAARSACWPATTSSAPAWAPWWSPASVWAVARTWAPPSGSQSLPP